MSIDIEALGADATDFRNAIYASLGGTAFPGSPTDGMRFYRSDLGLAFKYNGTRWLSDTLFHMPFVVAGVPYPLSASTNMVNSFPFPTLYDIWVEEFGVAALIQSATPGSNSFSSQLQKQTTNGAGVNVGGAAATSSLTQNVWGNSVVAVNEVIAKTVNVLLAAVTRVGSGSGYISPYMRYRIIGV
jgi:hypothetical protein